MKNTAFVLILLGLPHAASLCAAEMPMVAQPLVHERDGAVQGCGARLTGGETAAQSSAWFDVSFNVFRGGGALVQSYAYELQRSQSEGDARPARVPVQSAWIKAARGPARLGENGERRDTLVYPVALDDALALFETLAGGETMTIGIKRWDRGKDAVYAGKPALSDNDRRDLADCLARLTD